MRAANYELAAAVTTTTPPIVIVGVTNHTVIERDYLTVIETQATEITSTRNFTNLKLVMF